MQDTILMEHQQGLKRQKLIEEKIYNTFGTNHVRLVKEINGTLKFHISPDTKISTLIESLEKYKDSLKTKSREPTIHSET